jgi:hypothetical protein
MGMVGPTNPYRLMPNIRTSTVIDGAPDKKPPLLRWAVDMVVGHGDQADFPEVSGFAPLNNEELLAVRDTKPFHIGSSVLGTVDKESGTYTALEVDWSATGLPFDLEAIAAREPGGQDFLAVEGSRFFGRTPRLMELEVSPEGSRSIKAHKLPKLGQEIEGMVISAGQTQDTQNLILAGRGDGTEPSRIYWGTLDDDGLHFSEQGQTGVEVRGPSTGTDDQRDVTELVADQDGTLWASSTATVGSVGEYRSAVYQLGRLTQGEQPFALEPGEAFFVDGPKIEALQIDQGKIYMGSDNESLKGRLDIAER